MLKTENRSFTDIYFNNFFVKELSGKSSTSVYHCICGMLCDFITYISASSEISCVIEFHIHNIFVIVNQQKRLYYLLHDFMSYTSIDLFIYPCNGIVQCSFLINWRLPIPLKICPKDQWYLNDSICLYQVMSNIRV